MSCWPLGRKSHHEYCPELKSRIGTGKLGGGREDEPGQAESRSERQNSATAFFQPTHQAHYLRQKILTLTSNSKDYTIFLASIADYRYCAQILQICILQQLATTKTRIEDAYLGTRHAVRTPQTCL
jgi:hypothetical protein